MPNLFVTVCRLQLINDDRVAAMSDFWERKYGDAIIALNIVNRNSGIELIILLVWLDPLPHFSLAPFSFAEEGHSALD